MSLKFDKDQIAKIYQSYKTIDYSQRYTVGLNLQEEFSLFYQFLSLSQMHKSVIHIKNEAQLKICNFELKKNRLHSSFFLKQKFKGFRALYNKGQLEIAWRANCSIYIRFHTFTSPFLKEISFTHLKTQDAKKRGFTRRLLFW